MGRDDRRRWTESKGREGWRNPLSEDKKRYEITTLTEKNLLRVSKEFVQIPTS